MKKLILAAGLLGMIWGGGAIAKPADCATVSDPWNHANCERECGKDSSLDWCDDICTAEPDAGHSWCASEEASGSCQWVPVAAADVVSPVTQVQADIILDGHCNGTDPSEFAYLGLTTEQVVAQICKVDAAASYCGQ